MSELTLLCEVRDIDLDRDGKMVCENEVNVVLLSTKIFLYRSGYFPQV